METAYFVLRSQKKWTGLFTTSDESSNFVFSCTGGFSIYTIASSGKKMINAAVGWSVQGHWLEEEGLKTDPESLAQEIKE